MKVIQLNPLDLKEYQGNPRKITDRAVDAVAGSLKKFGWQQPVIIDKNNEIIIGHVRTRAAIKLKMQKVPCVMADKLTPQEVDALRLVDNKTGELVEWEWDKLQVSIQDLGASAVNLLDFAFDPGVLAASVGKADQIPDLMNIKPRKTYTRKPPSTTGGTDAPATAPASIATGQVQTCPACGHTYE